jgi:N-acetylglucosaminyldiphosphoundecaprenol N-acetyl-beta-D-mannosaminyltransferase
LSFKNNISAIHFLNAKDIDAVADFLIKEWHSRQQHQIVHFMYYASLELIRKNVAYAQAAAFADYTLVDGIGMQLYFKLTLGKTMSNLNGTDLSPVLIRKLVDKNIPIAFYGTTEAQILRCNEKLNQQYGKQVLSYFQNGYAPFDWSKINPNTVLLVGKGTPLQEIWTAENILHIKEKNIFVITVGGYFDFLSGLYIRAPKLVRLFKLEWFWRTVVHPKRHYQKRLRDMTIIFRPVLDRMAKVKDFFKIEELNF